MNPGALDELAKIPDGQPFAIINLLLYKEWAEYPEGTVTEKLTGQQAYERYSELSIQFVNKVGGIPMWRGSFGVILIGPEDARWDEILIMQYPARSAFEQMMADPEVTTHWLSGESPTLGEQFRMEQGLEIQRSQ